MTGAWPAARAPGLLYSVRSEPRIWRRASAADSAAGWPDARAAGTGDQWTVVLVSVRITFATALLSVLVGGPRAHAQAGGLFSDAC